MSLRIHALNSVEMDIAGLEQIFLYGGAVPGGVESVANGPLRPFGYRERVELPTGYVSEGCTNPAPIWYIEGAEKKILVETGVSGENVDTFNECCLRYGIHQYYNKHPEHDITKMLKERGVSPDEIDIVILTHIHPDHASNGSMFPNATFVAQQDTVAWGLTPPPWAPYYYPEMHKYTLDLVDRITMIEGHQKIVDGIEVIKVGGHVPGEQLVTVQVDSGLAIITGDAALTYNHLEHNWPMGTFWNVHEVIAAYDLIRRRADIVLPQHEMEIWHRYPDGIIE